MNNKVIDRNYGSIAHLSTSKMFQQADKKINIGQERILTEKTRDWKDLIIVTEKIDGSNVGVVRQGKNIIPVTRAGYHANTSPYEMHRIFSDYVLRNSLLFDWLPDGWRVCGEWCIQAHGTLYNITNESPFVAFDIIDDSNRRQLYVEFIKFCALFNIPNVPLLHIGQPISIKNALKLLGDGHYGEPEKPEGAVYRVEREGCVDFLAKYVRSDKEDGKYLNGNLPVWNYGYEKVI